MNLTVLKHKKDARILIRAANWVGDAIMTTPVIRAVRKGFPAARISVLAKPWVIPVYETNPHIDDIIIYRDGHRHKRGWGTFRLANDLKPYRFDMAFLMQNAFEAALISFLARIPIRIGYNTDGRTLLLKPSIRMNPALKKGHLIDYYIGILTGAGLENDGRGMDLFISETDKTIARTILEQHHIHRDHLVIGINPGATGGTAKRWFPERFADLAKKLAQAYKSKILIFGGPGDEKLGDDINDASGNACVNIAGKTTLGQAFALIDSCNLFITNDSGLMHAAAALGVNQVAVIGSTDHVATSPSNENSRMVRIPLACSPCLKKDCPTDHQCMDRISADMVFRECESILSTIIKEQNPV